MARKRAAAPPSPFTIVSVDDNREYLLTTVRLLEREGHTVLAYEDPRDALAYLRGARVDLVLVDYFMPEMTGEQLIAELRGFDPHVQVVLQTGYASEQPARTMLRRLDIQGYFDKSEGPDKLLMWVDVGLRAAAQLRALEQSRNGLRYILGVTPELHRMQPLSELLQGVLVQTAGLLGAVDAFVAVRPAPPDGFVALVRDPEDLDVRAGTGRFAGCGRLDAHLAADQRAAIAGALADGHVGRIGDATVVPLRVGDVTAGAIYVERPVESARDLELLQVFANQAAVAIHNAQLYQAAAFDPLTGAYTRRFLDHLLVRELRGAVRTRAPLGVIVVDVDAMKTINDTGGHLAGDQALAGIGAALRGATRATDAVGRYGGDEFVVVLPGATAAQVEAVAARIDAALAPLAVETAAGWLPVRASLGGAVFEPDAGDHALTADALTATVTELLRRADARLYDAKRGRPAAAGAIRSPAARNRP